MLNPALLANLVKTGFRASKYWVRSHRHTIITVATATADVGAVVYMGVNTEKAAAKIQAKRVEKGSEPTPIEKGIAIAKVDWPAAAMVGGSVVANVLDKKNILSQSAALAVNLANQSKANDALNKAIDDNLSSKDKTKVKKAANEEVAKNAVQEGAFRDYIPSMGRGTTIFLYQGIVFKGDINDGIAAYEEMQRNADDPTTNGLVTRFDLLNAWCTRAGGRVEDMPWYDAKSLRSMGWTSFTDTWNRTKDPDVASNLNDADLFVQADKCGLKELGHEPIAVLNDNAGMLSKSQWNQFYETGNGTYYADYDGWSDSDY